MGTFAIMNLMKRIILWIIERNKAGMKMVSLYRMWHHFEDIGYFKSRIAGLPVDKNSAPLPWLTYPAIYFLERKLKPDMRVFEYGSGNSTLWLSEHLAKVVSCEHNLIWYNTMKKKIPSNVEYIYSELVYDGEYSKVVKRYQNNFDIIVIDGRDRVNCIKNSLGALKDNGIFIIDNSERDAYSEGFQYLLWNGFKRIDFQGFGPINTCCWCTSFFYRNDNCLEI